MKSPNNKAIKHLNKQLTIWFELDGLTKQDFNNDFYNMYNLTIDNVLMTAWVKIPYNVKLEKYQLDFNKYKLCDTLFVKEAYWFINDYFEIPQDIRPTFSDYSYQTATNIVLGIFKGDE